MHRPDQFLVPSNREAVGHPGDEVTDGAQLLHLISAVLPPNRQQTRIGAIGIGKTGNDAMVEKNNAIRNIFLQPLPREPRFPLLPCYQGRDALVLQPLKQPPQFRPQSPANTVMSTRSASAVASCADSA